MEEIDGASGDVVVLNQREAADFHSLVPALQHRGRFLRREPTLGNERLHQVTRHARSRDEQELVRTKERIFTRQTGHLFHQLPDVRFGHLIDIRRIRTRDHTGRVPNRIASRRQTVQRAVVSTTVRDVDKTVHHVDASRCRVRIVRRSGLDHNVSRHHTTDARRERQRGVRGRVGNRRNGGLATERATRGVTHGDVVARIQEQPTLTRASHTVGSLTDNGHRIRHRADRGKNALTGTVEGGFHHQRRGFTDFFQRLFGNRLERGFLRLGAEEREAVNLTGHIATRHTHRRLFFLRKRIGREVARPRPRSTSRATRHDIPVRPVAAPAKIAGTASLRLLQLGKGRRHEVLHLHSVVVVQVLQQTRHICVRDYCRSRHWYASCMLEISAVHSPFLQGRMQRRIPFHPVRTRLV